jgi:hypothetical protein
LIEHWTGTWGYGYEVYSGGYSDTLSSMNPSVTIATQASSINPNGEKNVYTYRIQYGVLANADKWAGDYMGTASFGINLTY